MLAPGGTATIVGMVPFDEKIDRHAYALLGERWVQGSSIGCNRFRVEHGRTGLVGCVATRVAHAPVPTPKAPCCSISWRTIPADRQRLNIAATWCSNRRRRAHAGMLTA